MVRSDGIAGSETGPETAAQIDEMQDQGNVGGQPGRRWRGRPPSESPNISCMSISWA